MLPSWRDELRISLSPERVALARLGKGWRPRVVEKASEACEAGQSWRPAIAALQKLLGKHAGANATVVVSSRFSRYFTVPWSDELNGEEELAALARHRCGQVYGAPAADLDIRVSAGGYGMPMLACAMERGLLEALRQTCAGARVRLVSVQPALMAAFNRWRGQLNGEGGWFGIAEGDRLTLALGRQGGWQTVHGHYLEAGLAGGLQAVLEQERLLAELPDAPRSVLLFAPEQPNFAPPSGKWPVRVLKLSARDGFSPHEDAAFGLAMCGGN